MGRYRKIDTRIWNDAKFSSLSDKGKLAFLFLLTHPHLTSLGAMRATISGLANELSWSEKVFRDAISELLRAKLVECEEAACFFCLPNFLKYNGPESPNVVKSWESALDLIPECRSKVTLLARVRRYTDTLAEGFAKALPKAFQSGRVSGGLPEEYGEPLPKGMPYPEQEQEQEQEQEPKKRKASAHAVPCFEIPPGSILDVPEFRASWQDWLAHRREIKHALTPTQASKQISQFESWGLARSLAAIEFTITKGWQGIREPDATPPANGKKDRPAYTVEELFGEGYGK